MYRLPDFPLPCPVERFEYLESRHGILDVDFVILWDFEFGLFWGFVVEDWLVVLLMEGGSEKEADVKIDMMRGTKLFCGRIYNRRHFDIGILILFLGFGSCVGGVVYGKVMEGSCTSFSFCPRCSS